MHEFELREEIKWGGEKYFLQTSYNPDKGVVESSFFRSGKLLDSLLKKVDDKSSSNVRDLTKNVHEENKKNLDLLMTARDMVKSSSDSRPHIKLAEALYRRNILPEAIDEAQLAIEKGDENSKPYEIMGRVYYRMGDYEKAYHSIKKGLKINPDYPDLFNMLGLVYLKRNRCIESIRNFKMAIDLNQYYGEAYLNLASAYILNSIVREDYELSKDLDSKVLPNLEMASRLIPVVGDELLDNIELLLKEKNYQEAYDYLVENRKVEKKNDIGDILLNIYLMIVHRGEDLLEGEIDGYLREVEKLVDRNPTFADGYNGLGILYIAKCKVMIDKASEAFRKSVEINGDYQEARKNLRLTDNDRQGVFILLKALLD